MRLEKHSNKNEFRHKKNSYEPRTGKRGREKSSVCPLQMFTPIVTTPIVTFWL